MAKGDRARQLLAESTKSSGQTMKVLVVLDMIDKADRAVFEEALRNPRISDTTIARAITAMLSEMRLNESLSSSAVRNYRSATNGQRAVT